jgi:hypothetical protein
MINSFTVTNPSGESLMFDLRRPELSGFLVSDISGLGPVVAIINDTELASSDGSKHNSARLGARNIVISFIFMDMPTIEATRLMSYRYFPIKKKVSLIFETEGRLCQTEGYVESNSPNIFSPQSGTQVSIVCQDPYFYSLDTNTTVFTSIVPIFEFEFFTDTPIEFGQVSTLTSGNVYYEGDAAIGVTFDILANGPVGDLSIYNSTTQEALVIESARLSALTGSGIVSGDQIYISTIKGDKYVVLLREGTEVNILNALTKTSDWISLVSGDNIIGYTATSGVENIQLTVQNNIMYEGI